jgi:hypothetical protein
VERNGVVNIWRKVVHRCSNKASYFPIVAHQVEIAGVSLTQTLGLRVRRLCPFPFQTGSLLSAENLGVVISLQLLLLLIVLASPGDGRGVNG